MDRHKCKLCFRHFANGRALGGHMRSHVMNDYLVKKPSKITEQESEAEEQLFDENLDDDDFHSVQSYSSTSSSDDEVDEDDGYEEDAEKVPALMDPGRSFSVVVQDRESETESTKKNPVSRRSKRVRSSDFGRLCMNGFFQVKKSKFEGEEKSKNKVVAVDEHSPLMSSISETSTEEDVAHCLIMMSKDTWDRVRVQVQAEDDDDDDDDDGDEKFDYSEDSGVVKVVKSSGTTKVRGKYRCETCNKLFRSYQALGGHRASHKKIKVNSATVPGGGGGGGGGSSAAAASVVVVVEKTHECPFCHRVFASGQALGGHKRTHFIGAGAVPVRSNTPSPVRPIPRVVEPFNIDLNLPAPIDDEDEISQVAVSAVSDAEFRASN